MARTKRGDIIDCDVCGEKCTSGEPLDEETEGTDLPPGWATLIGRRVVPNPGYKASEEEAQNALLDDIITSAREAGQFQKEGEEYQTRLALRPLLSLVPPQDENPEYIVEELEAHLCPKHNNQMKAWCGAPFAPAEE